jgi:hypothetical protein
MSQPKLHALLETDYVVQLDSLSPSLKDILMYPHKQMIQTPYFCDFIKRSASDVTHCSLLRMLYQLQLLFYLLCRHNTVPFTADRLRIFLPW